MTLPGRWWSAAAVAPPTANFRGASKKPRRFIPPYDALFHFLLEEVGRKIVGTHGDLLERRRSLARRITHRGAKDTLDALRAARSAPCEI